MSVTLALLLLLSPVVPQDDPDSAYREDYADYTEIFAMTDPAAQTLAYLDFLEEGFDERLLEFVISGTKQGLANLTQAGNQDAVYALADRLATLHPDAAADAGALALDAAATSGNAEQIAKYGEPFYEAMPSSQIALLLTRAHGQLQNQAKMIEYGRIVLDSGDYPIADVWTIAYEIIQDDEGAGRTLQAVTLARGLRTGVTNVPSGMTRADWNSVQVYLLDLIARADFDGGRYPTALVSFDAILDLQPRNDKAWYFKGNAMLQLGSSINEATQALAKAAVLEGNYAAPANDLLVSTFSRNAPGDTATRYVNDALAEARRQLGL